MNSSQNEWELWQNDIRDFLTYFYQDSPHDFLLHFLIGKPVETDTLKKDICDQVYKNIASSPGEISQNYNKRSEDVFFENIRDLLYKKNGRNNLLYPRFQIVPEPCQICGLKFWLRDWPNIQDKWSIFPFHIEDSVFIKFIMNDLENIYSNHREYFSILEIATGTGALSIHLFCHLMQKKIKSIIHAIDINPRVETFFLRNLLLNVHSSCCEINQGPVNVQCSNHGTIELTILERLSKDDQKIFECISSLMQHNCISSFDYVISNPPFEPVPPWMDYPVHSAGGEDGLDFFREILLNETLLSQTKKMMCITCNLGSESRPSALIRVLENWLPSGYSAHIENHAQPQPMISLLLKHFKKVHHQSQREKWIQWIENFTNKYWTFLHFVILTISERNVKNGNYITYARGRAEIEWTPWVSPWDWAWPFEKTKDSEELTLKINYAMLETAKWVEDRLKSIAVEFTPEHLHEQLEHLICPQFKSFYPQGFPILIATRIHDKHYWVTAFSPDRFENVHESGWYEIFVYKYAVDFKAKLYVSSQTFWVPGSKLRELVELGSESLNENTFAQKRKIDETFEQFWTGEYYPPFMRDIIDSSVQRWMIVSVLSKVENKTIFYDLDQLKQHFKLFEYDASYDIQKQNLLSTMFTEHIVSLVLRQYRFLLAARSAISAIIARNVSHNIGSHVLALISMMRIEHPYAEPNKCKELFIWAKKVQRLIRYVQHRMDFCAMFATDWPKWFETTFLFRHIIRGFLSHAHLLDYIAEGEGLRGHRYPASRNNENKGNSQDENEKKNGSEEKIESARIHSRDCICYKRYKEIKATCAESEENIILYTPAEGDAVCHSKSDIQIAIRGGFAGRHAFYSFLENFIRNSAKHQFTRNGRTKTQHKNPDKHNEEQNPSRPDHLDVIIEILDDSNLPDNKKPYIQSHLNLDEPPAPAWLIRIYDNVSRIEHHSQSPNSQEVTAITSSHEQTTIDDHDGEPASQSGQTSRNSSEASMDIRFHVFLVPPDKWVTSSSFSFPSQNDNASSTASSTGKKHDASASDSAQNKKKSVICLLNSRLAQSFIDRITYQSRKENWGLQEMKIMAGFLQNRDIIRIASESQTIPGMACTHCQSNDNSQKTNYPPPINNESLALEHLTIARIIQNNAETPLSFENQGEIIIRAISSPAGTIGYEFYLRKPIDIIFAVPEEVYRESNGKFIMIDPVDIT